MGNLLSSTHEGHSSPQGGDSSAEVNINIQGDGSGNSGSYNKISSDNTTINNYYGGTSSTQNHAEILQCLYTSRYESHRGRVRKPADGTCTWVTEHPKYKEWSEKGGLGLLWLSADPGCGKSVTASFLVSHLKRQPNTLVCYFFFKDDSEEQRSATFALSAILHQLFEQRDTLCTYAEPAFRARGKRFTEEADTLWDILVKAVTEGGCGDVICVIDALDECDDRTLAPLIRHITALQGSETSNLPLKFLVTGRPYHKIERELGSPATTIRLKGEDEIGAITSDVSRVIDEGIKDLESYWGRPGGLEYLRDLLESSADRTFLWVSLILGILKDSEDDSPEEFTNIVSSSPRDIAELYSKILDKSTHPEKARLILNIVVAAARPLTLEEINIAFKIRREHSSIKDVGDLPGGFERTVKNLCGLFVRVIDSRIYLVHQTAREFLIKGSFSGQGNWQYSICPQDSHLIMADICISYLLLQEFENDPLPEYTNMFAEMRAVSDYLEKHVFLDYSARHWADHFRESKSRQMELFDLTRLICGAGSNCLRTWLRVYWLNTLQEYIFPEDLTHLMVASWLGQEAVVARLLEDGGDINARSELYGTALNIAADRNDKGITGKLMRGDVKAYFDGSEYNILQTKKSELEAALAREKFTEPGSLGLGCGLGRRSVNRITPGSTAKKLLTPRPPRVAGCCEVSLALLHPGHSRFARVSQLARELLVL